MPMTPKEMIKLLEANGFVQARKTGSHLTMKNPNTHKVTVVPMHNKDLGKGLEQAILKQAGLK
nr:MAG TPA: HicA toxin [Caudoviricetes sp.]